MSGLPAIDGTPVAVVFFKSPVASPESKVPLSLTVVVAIPALVVSPVRLPVIDAAEPLVF